ncbi:MAG: hypothetical protein KBS95_08270 [Alistipes sp.]|nr:hypothetical protein [Candidatus Alistipes equi]
MIIRTYLKKDFHTTILYHRKKVHERVAFFLHQRGIVASNDSHRISAIEYTFLSFAKEYGINKSEVAKKTRDVLAHIIVVIQSPHAVTLAEYRSGVEEVLRKMGFSNEPFVAIMHLDSYQLHMHIMVPIKPGVKYDLRYRSSENAWMRWLEQGGEKPTSLPDISLPPSLMYRADSMLGPLSIQVRHLAGGVASNYIFQDISTFDAALRLYGIALRLVDKTNEKIKHDYGMAYRLTKLVNKHTISVSASSLRCSLMRPHIEKECQKEFMPLGILRTFTHRDCMELFQNPLNCMFHWSEAGIDTVLKKQNGKLEDIILVDHIQHESISLFSLLPSLSSFLGAIESKAIELFGSAYKKRNLLYSFADNILAQEDSSTKGSIKNQCSLRQLLLSMQKSEVVVALKKSREAVGDVMISIFQSVRMETMRLAPIPMVERMKNITTLLSRLQECEKMVAKAHFILSKQNDMDDIQKMYQNQVRVINEIREKYQTKNIIKEQLSEDESTFDDTKKHNALKHIAK